MLKKVLEIYKIQLLISITILVIILVVKSHYIYSLIYIILVAMGCLLGTFFLDLDYFVYAYFIEPEKPFSKTLKGYVAHSDFANAFNHIYYNKSEVKDKTLNSVLFQMVLAGACIFTITATSIILFKAFILSVLANSIYKMATYYFDGRASEWFWALKKAPTENGILVYGLILVLVLAYSISIF